jgi:phosphatidylinositol 4-kinase
LGDIVDSAGVGIALIDQLAVALAQRQGLAPAGSAARAELVKLLVGGAWDPRVQQIPEAAMLLVQASSAGDAVLHSLSTWAVAGGVDGLQLMAGPLADASPAVKAYAIRCLHAAQPEKLAFFLPQLVQSLRHDKDGTLAAFLKVHTCACMHAGMHVCMYACACINMYACRWHGTLPPWDALGCM